MTIGIVAAVFAGIALVLKFFGFVFTSIVFALIGALIQNFIPVWSGIFTVWPWTMSAIDSKEIFKIWAIWSLIVTGAFAIVIFSVLISSNDAKVLAIVDQ